MFAMISIVVLAFVLCAWIAAIALFIGVKREKGYSSEGNGLLWIIGIFATPIVVGLYVIALPDKRLVSASEAASQRSEELPEV